MRGRVENTWKGMSRSRGAREKRRDLEALQTSPMKRWRYWSFTTWKSMTYKFNKREFNEWKHEVRFELSEKDRGHSHEISKDVWLWRALEKARIHRPERLFLGEKPEWLSFMWQWSEGKTRGWWAAEQEAKGELHNVKAGVKCTGSRGAHWGLTHGVKDWSSGCLRSSLPRHRWDAHLLGMGRCDDLRCGV